LNELFNIEPERPMLTAPAPTAQSDGLEAFVSIRVYIEKRYMRPGFIKGENGSKVNPAVGFRRNRHVEPPPGIGGIAPERNVSPPVQRPDARHEELPQFPSLVTVEVGPEGAVWRRDRQLGGIVVTGEWSPTLPNVGHDVVGINPILDDHARRNLARRSFFQRYWRIRPDRRLDPVPDFGRRINPFEVRYLKLSKQPTDPTRDGNVRA
jgi:hypothetical protein